MIDGGRMVSRREGRPPELKPHRLRARLERARLLQERLHGILTAQLDVDVDQPEQRGEVARPLVVRPLEGAGGLFQVSAPLVDVPQVVGPPEPLRREPARVQEAGLRRVVVLAGHQEHPQAAIRVSQLAGPGRGGGLEGPVSVAELALDRFVHARQVGQLHRQDIGVVDGDPGRPARGQQAGREHAARHYRAPHGRDRQPVAKTRVAPRPGGVRREPRRPSLHHRGLPGAPVPSASVVQPSTSTPVHSSVRPLGQITRTRSTAAVSPRPTSTRGSLADA